MERTKTLMAGIVASVLFMGPRGFGQPVQDSAATGQGTAQHQETPQQLSEDRVEKAAEAIFQQLTQATKAMSLAELLQGLADQTLRNEAEAAMQELLDERRIRRTGSGSEAEPYLYAVNRGTNG